MMKKRLIAFLLCISMLLPLFTGTVPMVHAEGGGSSYHENIGRQAKFDLTYSNFPIVSDPTSIAAKDVFSTDISVSSSAISADLVVEILNCFVNEAEGIYWYRIEAAEGHVLPEAFPENPWVFQNYTGSVGGESLIILEKEPEETEPEVTEPEVTEPEVTEPEVTEPEVTEPEATEPEATEPEATEPGTCPICGQVGCVTLHFYCDICKKYDCGLTHPYCSICKVFDCAEDHIWCGSCGIFDCSITHEDIYTPVTQPVIPENPTLDGGAVCITNGAGEAVTSSGLILLEGRKISLSAWSVLGNAVSYQWQIRYDAANDRWANIQGQTGKGILISPAMFLSLGDDAAIRCVTTSGDETQISDAIPVTVEKQVETNSLSSSSSNFGIATIAEEDEDKVNLIISYQFANGSIAANSWIATLPGDEAYSTTDPIRIPMITGYAPEIDIVVEGATLNGYDLSLNLSAEQLATDMTIKIVYQPALTTFTVMHYLQNVDDNNYTLKETIVHENELVTGMEVGDVHNVYAGFHNLLYEHPKVAADGSTTIEIYYDRFYYLMKFDLGNAGYGVEPFYDRYGSAFPGIGRPTRYGYDFLGWSLDGITATALPTTVPAEHVTYKALWKPLNTQYTVSYWIANDDGTRSLIGSYVKPATSEEIVSGRDNLGTVTSAGEAVPENERGYICHEEQTHIHTQACYQCGLLEHGHVKSCYGTPKINYPGNGEAAIAAVNDGKKNPESGYIYVVETTAGARWPKLYLEDENGNGAYYTINGIGDPNPATQEQINSIISSGWLGEVSGTFNGEELKVIKYKARTICGEAHHQDACLSCNEGHTHDSSCRYDTKHVEFVDEITVGEGANEKTFKTSKNVKVSGDGTTVVDVYYTYKTYMIRFIYAKKVNGGYQIATNTGNGNLKSGCSWSNTVSGTPPVFTDPDGDKGLKEVTIDGETFYYISLTAKFGENITDSWPANNPGTVNVPNNWWGTSTYLWGSWAAAPGTKYRTDYGDAHANIVGPYPIMSADMIVANPEEITIDGKTIYVAQNMPAWWGSGQGIEAHAYHNYFVVPSGVPEDPNETYATYNGKRYKLEKTFYFTAAHNTDTRVDPVQFEGYKVVNEDKDKQESSSNFKRDCSICGDKSQYCNDFFYDGIEYKLSFWNHDDHLTDGTGSQVAYKEPLKKYFYGTTYNGTVYEGANDLVLKPEKYPKSLKPGVYQFGGWYSSPQFQEETRINPDTDTMPAEPITAHAKWIPITHTVSFYLDVNQYKAGKTIPEQLPEEQYQKFATRTVDHGDEILGLADPGEAGDDDDHPYEGYVFVGWFYEDPVTKEEKAFQTGEGGLTVTQDMGLYAKWSANALCAYEVFFALDAVNNDTGVEGPDGLPDKDADGNIIYVADSIKGSALAGNSRTFDAKGGRDLYDPAGDVNYQEGYFPNVASHGITLLLENSDIVTEFTFLYTPKASVPYQVLYLEKGTNKQLADPITYEDTKTNKNAVVTENFVPIDKYMPDEFQKTLVVIPGEDNEIIFYYTQDEEHALYQVNHYIENLEGGWSEASPPATFTGVIGQTYSAVPKVITGFDFNDTYTKQYNITEKVNAYTTDPLPGKVTFNADTDTVSGELTANGMQLNLYYVRKDLEYKVNYLEFGTNKVLRPAKTGTAKYGKLVTETAANIELDMDGDGETEDFKLYDPKNNTQSATIKDNSVVMTFYYVRCTQSMTITKQVVGESTDKSFELTLTAHATDFNEYSYAYTIKNGEETIKNGYFTPDTSSIVFSLKQGETITIEGLPTAKYTVTETAVEGYKAEYAPAQTNVLTESGRLDVVVTNRPTSADLTITREGECGDQVFVYEVRNNETHEAINVTIAGNGSVIIRDLPLGEYTVTQVKKWSWQYVNEAHGVTISGINANVTFDGKKDDKWLNGNSNLLKNVYGGG